MDDALRRLRDRTAITRLLIIAELQRRPGATLSDVAKALGVSVQAISVHARTMAQAGQLRLADGSYVAAPKGLQALHEGVRHLHDALTAIAEPLDVIQVTSAVAAGAVAKGAPLHLFMEDGDLAARATAGPVAGSRGRALAAARMGEEVLVGELQGLVQLEPGRLTLISLPGPGEGGIVKVADAHVLDLLREAAPAKVGAHGTGARILARRLAKSHPKAARLDFEFAADRAAFNAAERGLDVVLLVTRDRLPEAMEAVERMNAETLRRVAVDLVEAPLDG